MKKQDEKNMIDEDVSIIKERKKEVRKLKVFRADTIDELIEKVNQFVEKHDAKIINYTIETVEMRKECILFYSKLITVKQ